MHKFCFEVQLSDLDRIALNSVIPLQGGTYA